MTPSMNDLAPFSHEGGRETWAALPKRHQGGRWLPETRSGDWFLGLSCALCVETGERETGLARPTPETPQGRGGEPRGHAPPTGPLGIMTVWRGPFLDYL